MPKALFFLYDALHRYMLFFQRKDFCFVFTRCFFNGKKIIPEGTAKAEPKVGLIDSILTILLCSRNGFETLKSPNEIGLLDILKMFYPPKGAVKAAPMGSK